MSRGLALATVMSGLLTFSGTAMSCDSTKMMTADSGFIFKVVGRSDMVEAKVDRDGKEAAFILESLAPYYVLCEEDRFYRIMDVPAQTIEQAVTGRTGYVAKSEVYAWPTREALRFAPLALGGDRQDVLAWDDPAGMRKFLESGDAKLAPPSYREDLQSALRRDPARRPYPVLAGKNEKLRGVVEKRVFNVLLPATSPDARVVIELEAPVAAEDARTTLLNRLDRAMTTTTVAIAYDSTMDMERFAQKLAQELRALPSSVPEELQNALRIGFVFFRDETDDEKYLVIEPQNIAGAASALMYAARPQFMWGGGDPPEPVLDAVYIAHHLFSWGSAGRKVVVAVLGEDAKPTTLGKIHDSVPPGLSPSEIAADLVADGIPVISVQNFPRAGPNLVPVLSTLGESTGGAFLGWTADGGDPSRQVAALAERLVAAAKDTFLQGKKDLSIVQIDDHGKARLPLAFFDGEKLDRLRSYGLKFHVDAGKETALLRQGYLIENGELLDPVIQVDKKTLERLISLFAAVGVTGGGADAMRECAAQILAAASGEDYDPNESMEATNRKRQALQFRTRLLDFNIEDIAGMNRDERVAMAKRIQNGSTILTQFLDAHAEELSRSPTIWLPVSLLP